MQTETQHNETDLELITELAKKTWVKPEDKIEPEELIKNTELLADLERLSANRAMQKAKILDMIPCDDLGKELEKTAQMAKRNLIAMQIDAYQRHRKLESALVA